MPVQKYIIVGVGILLLVAGFGLIALPQALLSFGNNAGVGIKGDMAETVASGEPFGVDIYLINTTPISYAQNTPYGSNLDGNTYTYNYMFSPECIIASIDGARSLVSVESAANGQTDIPVLTNGNGLYSSGLCHSSTDQSKGAILLKWGNNAASNLASAQPYPINSKLMHITIGGYAAPGTHTLSVAFPCTPAAVFCWLAEGKQYCDSYTGSGAITQSPDYSFFNYYPSGMCGFSKQFTIQAPQSMQIISTLNVSTDAGAETVTTTYLTTTGSTITQTVGNSSIAPVTAALVVNDQTVSVQNVNGITTTTTQTTGAAEPIGILNGGGFKLNYVFIALGAILVIAGWRWGS